MTDITPRTFRLWDIPAEDLSAIDLREEATNHTAQSGEPNCYVIEIDGQAERAEAVWFSRTDRIGIAWGANADWADYDDPEQAINDYLNDGETYAARN